MMSPLVTLKRRSSVIADSRSVHAARDGGDPRRTALFQARPSQSRGNGARKPPLRALPARSGRPLHVAARRALGGGGLVACDDIVDTEQVLGIARWLGQRFAHEGRSHELVVPLAVVALVGL